MQRRIHLATGLVLFAFVVSHVLSHAAGLIGLPAQIAAGGLFHASFGNPVVLGLVTLCFVTHAASAFVILFRRRQLEIGSGASASITAIGDTVNTAARLEQLTKEADAPLVVSVDVLRQAGLDETVGAMRLETIRGRSDRLGVVAITDLAALAAPPTRPRLAEAAPVAGA